MKAKKIDYTEMNKLVKKMGLQGKDGDYKTQDGKLLDLSDCDANRLSIGYKVAKVCGLITYTK
jgi:hypothetical protein